MKKKDAPTGDRPAVLYARFSPRPIKKKKKGEDELESNVRGDVESCLTQLSYLGNRVTSMPGVAIVKTYQDDRLSGASIDNRPGLQAALEHVCRVKGILMVYSISRLARNTSDAIAITRRLEKAGADLYSLRDNVDTSTPIGRLFFTMVAAWATFEREVTAERTADAMQSMQARGRVVTRADQVPYGWKLDPENHGRMVESPEEAAVIASLRQWMKDEPGISARALARRLDNEGIKARSGSKFSHNLVRKIIARLPKEEGT